MNATHPAPRRAPVRKFPLHTLRFPELGDVAPEPEQPPAPGRRGEQLCFPFFRFGCEPPRVGRTPLRPKHYRR